MKIGVISDTHGNVDALNKALELFEGADMIAHAGDVLYHPPRLGFLEGYDIPAFADVLNGLRAKVVIAQGNCDAQVCEELLDIPVQSPGALVEHGGLRLLVMHGHLPGLRGQNMTREQMIETARRCEADYFITGHTHLPVLEDAGGVILMNPGSPAIPKLEIDGKPVPTVGLITDSGASILNLNDGSTILELKTDN